MATIMIKQQDKATTNSNKDNIIFQNSIAWLWLLLYWVVSACFATYITDCSLMLIRDLRIFISSFTLFSPASTTIIELKSINGNQGILKLGVEFSLISGIVFSTMQAAKAYRNSCTTFRRKLSLFTLIVYSLINSIADTLAGMVAFRIGEETYNVIFGMLRLGFDTDADEDTNPQGGDARVGIDWYHSLGTFFTGYMYFAMFMGQRGTTLEPHFWPPHQRPEVKPGTYVPWLIMASTCSLVECYFFNWSIPYFLLNTFFSAWSIIIIHPSPPWSPPETYAFDATGRVHSKLS